MKAPVALALLALAAPSSASDLLEGNALGGAWITVTPAYIGGNLEIVIGTDNPNNSGAAILSISGGYAETFVPSLGYPVALDVTSPLYNVFGLPLLPDDTLTLTLPQSASTINLFGISLYGNNLTFEDVGISLSKTSRVTWETHDSFRPIGEVMANPRLLHSATPLGADAADNRAKILVAGGADGSIIIPEPTASTELFQPASMLFDEGPDMSIPRSGHSATRLNDGRVLIAGGVTTGGVISDTAEIYDPETNTFSAAASMSTMRSAHRATLLGDGRVLVTGGFSDWQNAAVFFIAALQTSQRTTEIYDPNTDTWSPGPDMIDDRSGHSQTLLPDGRVLIVSGINGGASDPWSGGGQFPTYTSTCEIFDANADSLTVTGNLLPARAFHGASVLGNGDVLVSGGIVAGGSYGEAFASSDCRKWSGAVWAPTGSLPETMSFVSQVTMDDGNALIMGGYVGDLSLLAGSSSVGSHNGIVFTPRTTLGLNANIATSEAAPRGAATISPVGDGTYLILGGSGAPDVFSTTTFDDGFIYMP